jgi:hypothetical protein
MARSRRWIDLAIAAFAVALIIAGAVAVFVVDNGAGMAAVLAAGSLLLVVAALGDRIESLRWGELELELRRQADAAGAHVAELRDAADALARRRWRLIRPRSLVPAKMHGARISPARISPTCSGRVVTVSGSTRLPRRGTS